MNVLVSCAGRRSYLVDWFRAAVAPGGRVVAVNSVVESTALAAADSAYVSPPLADAGYVDFLLDVCWREEIGLVVPVFDLELPVLAAAVGRFRAAGVVVAVSSGDVIGACQDKLATADVARRAGLLGAAATLDPDEAVGWLAAGVGAGVRQAPPRDGVDPHLVDGRPVRGGRAAAQGAARPGDHVPRR